jgi:hypothetical protein
VFRYRFQPNRGVAVDIYPDIVTVRSVFIPRLKPCVVNVSDKIDLTVIRSVIRVVDQSELKPEGIKDHLMDARFTAESPVMVSHDEDVAAGVTPERSLNRA